MIVVRLLSLVYLRCPSRTITESGQPVSFLERRGTLSQIGSFQNSLENLFFVCSQVHSFRQGRSQGTAYPKKNCLRELTSPLRRPCFVICAAYSESTGRRFRPLLFLWYLPARDKQQWRARGVVAQRNLCTSQFPFGSYCIATWCRATEVQ